MSITVVSARAGRLPVTGRYPTKSESNTPSPPVNAGSCRWSSWTRAAGSSASTIEQLVSPDGVWLHAPSPLSTLSSASGGRGRDLEQDWATARRRSSALADACVRRSVQLPEVGGRAQRPAGGGRASGDWSVHRFIVTTQSVTCQPARPSGGLAHVPGLLSPECLERLVDVQRTDRGSTSSLRPRPSRCTPGRHAGRSWPQKGSTRHGGSRRPRPCRRAAPRR